jgi:diguanylate cyclase (GGDEF)-like protein
LSYSIQAFFKAVAFPVLLFVGVIISVETGFADLSPWQDLILQTPLLLFIATIILALRFNQTRIIYIVLFIALAWANTGKIENIDYFSFHPSLFFISQLLVIMAFSFDQNKVVWGRHGLVRILTLLAIVAINYRFNHSITVNEWLSAQVIGLSEDSKLSPYFQIELLVSALCLFALAVRQLLKPSQLNASLWALAFGVIILQFGDFTYYTTIMSYCLFGVVIIHAVLTDSYQMAFSDELTGLAARRALLQSSISLGKKYTVAMMDVDHFKKFNDTYGHDVGDQVLRLVASKMNQVKGGGKAYRYGGEEFTVVFPNKSVAHAIPYLEQVREDIANYQMAIRSDDRPEDEKSGQSSRKKNEGGTKFVNVTISIGVAEREGELKDFDQVLKRSDEALYRAKQAGRNCLAE